MTGHPQRRLADRLLDAGVDVARRYVEADRYDPGRPSLGMLVAETLAEHERIGEERIRAKIRALIEQRTTLRDDRLRRGVELIQQGNAIAGSGEVSWAAALDEQLGALRLLLVDDPAPVEEDQPA